MAHTGQPRPDSGLDFQVNALKIFQAFPSSLGRGPAKRCSILFSVGGPIFGFRSFCWPHSDFPGNVSAASSTNPTQSTIDKIP